MSNLSTNYERLFLDVDSTVWNSDPIPETDSTPHVNIGPQFQCSIPPLMSSANRNNPQPCHEDLLWDPGINCSDAESKYILYYKKNLI